MANHRQNNLPGVEVANHSNMGKEWESMLKATHDFYRRQRIIDVVRNDEKWERRSIVPPGMTVDNFLASQANPEIVAVNAKRHVFIKTASDVDFSGGNGSFAIAFDAKETAGVRIPMKAFKSHQILRLRESDRCGAHAGFMIWFYEVDRVFFAPVKFIIEKQEKFDRLPPAGKQREKGTASVSINELETRGVEVYKGRNGAFFDWYAALARPKQPIERPIVIDRPL